MTAACACEAGRSDRQNEDWAGFAGSVAVVLDGATTLDGSICHHGTPWYVQQLGIALLDLAATDASLADALSEAIARVTHRHSSCGGSPAATVAMLRLTDERVEYLVLADTTLVLDHGDDLSVITDTRVDEVTNRVGQAETRNYHIGTAEHRAAVEHMNAAQQAWRNREGGYWVAADDPDAAEQSITGTVPLDDLQRAILMTDGASRLADTFGEPWPDVLDLLDRAGPRELIKNVRTYEDRDPQGQRWPRFKTSDDACCLYLAPSAFADRFGRT